MSAAIDDGGPAYPGTEENGLNSGWSGMTLRDKFADTAMGAIRSDCDYMKRFAAHCDKAGVDLTEAIAKLAYVQADAMLRARVAK